MRTSVGMVYYWDATDRNGWRSDFRTLRRMGVDYIVACDILSLQRTLSEDRQYVMAALDEARTAGLRVVLNVFSGLLMNDEHLPYSFLNPLYLSGCLLPYRYTFPKYRHNIEYSREAEKNLFVDCFDYVYPMFDVLSRKWRESFLTPYLAGILRDYGSHPAVAGLRFTDLLHVPETGPYGAAHPGQFRQFLGSKYGDNRALNMAWKTRHRSFAAVPLPRIPRVWSPEWTDWCEYRTGEVAGLARFIRDTVAGRNPGLRVSFAETDFAIDRSWHAFGGVTPDFVRCASDFAAIPDRSSVINLPPLFETARNLCGKTTVPGLSVRVTRKAYLQAPSAADVREAVRCSVRHGAGFIEYDYYRMPPFPGNTYPRNTGLSSSPGLCTAVARMNRTLRAGGRI